MSDSGFDFDFEERLRATITRRSEGFEPSPDLPDRIDARVSHHRRRRQLVTGGLASAAAVALAVVAVAVGGRDEDPIRMIDDGGSAVTRPGETTPNTPTSSPSTSPSTADTSTSSTTVPPPETPSGLGLDPLTPLSRDGIGPITAGMTLREAQEAAGVTITPSAGGTTCVEALIDGFDPSPVLVVEPSGQPGGDPLDGIVRAVAGSVLPSDEGAMVGQSRAELLASLGQPTRTEDASADVGFAGDLLVFEAGGFAYGALVVDDVVYGLQSGDPDWVSGADGCPE